MVRLLALQAVAAVWIPAELSAGRLTTSGRGPRKSAESLHTPWEAGTSRLVPVSVLETSTSASTRDQCQYYRQELVPAQGAYDARERSAAAASTKGQGAPALVVLALDADPRGPGALSQTALSAIFVAASTDHVPS